MPPPAAPALELRSWSAQRSLAAAAPARAHYSVLLVESNGGLELFFGAPNQILSPPDRGTGCLLRFTEECVEPTSAERELLWPLFHREEPGPVRASPEISAEIRSLLPHLQDQPASADALDTALRRTYLKTLLLRCAQLSQQQFGTARPVLASGLVARFQRLLEQHYTRWKSVHEYAVQLHVTANHLSVTIRRQTGHTAGEHIRRRLMREARRLAAASDTTLKEVAYQLGFDDPAHFSKLFKRCTGSTFSAFRQQQTARPRLARAAA